MRAVRNRLRDIASSFNVWAGWRRSRYLHGASIDLRAPCEQPVRLKNDDHGVRADHVLTMRLPFGSWFHSARTPEEKLKQTRRYLNLLDRVRSVPGVDAAALSSSLPLSNVNVTTVLPTPSETARADNARIGVRTLAVTGDYFRVMGTP